MQNAQDIMRALEPNQLENIQSLFSGHLVSLDIFSRAMQTFIPKKYQTTQAELQSMALAILDLFEELDSDCDGFITFKDFQIYYEQSTNEQVTAHVPALKSVTIFKNIQSQQGTQAGKTGQIIVESLLPENGEVRDIQGTRILAMESIQDWFYLVTDAGLFACDTGFVFSRKIFQPTIALIQTQKFEKNDRRIQERRLHQAYELLKQFNVKASQAQQIQEPKTETQEETLHLHSTNVEPTVANCSTVVASIFIPHVQAFALCLQYPVVFFVSVQGQISPYYKLESMATALLWDSVNNNLYVGHDTGKVTKYQIISMKHKLKGAEEVQLKDSKEINEDNYSIKKLKEIMARKGITKDQLSQLTKQEILEIYPDLKQIVIDQFGEPGSIVRAQQKEQAEQKKKVEKVLGIDPDSIQISGLLSDIIFDLDKSAISAAKMSQEQIVQEDPQAFIDVYSKPNVAQAAIIEKKHGSVVLNLQFNLMCSDYITKGAVRCLAGGWGYWEKQMDAHNFRIVVAGQDGSIVVINEMLEEVAAFADLHPEGILNVHVMNDQIVTVGYENVFLIDPEMVHLASQGSINIGEGKTAKLDSEKLLEGNLIKAQLAIRELQPPRPGTPIIHSFMFGNIIGIVDHDSVLTLFHAVSGMNLTRSMCNFPNLLLSRFGLCCYNFSKETAYIPIGLCIYSAKAIPNEEIHDDEAVLDVLQFQGPHEQNDISEQVQIGSIHKDIVNFVINQALNEIAVVTGSLEITFYSLETGKPARFLNIKSFQTDAIEQMQGKRQYTEYTAIESNDTIQLYSETFKFKSKSVGQKQIPQILPKIESIVDILGDQILNISIDVKGRILFVLGTLGVCCFYWKSGKLFDINNTGIIGKQEEIAHNELIKNPFVKPKRDIKVEQVKPAFDGELNTYSLNIKFNQLIDANHIIQQSVMQKQRQIITFADKLSRRLYINDSLNPTMVFCISTATVQEFINSPVNARVIKKLQVEKNIEQQELTKIQVLMKQYNDSLSSSKTFTGQIENAIGLEKVQSIIPKQFWNNQRNSVYQYKGTNIREVIETLCENGKQTEFKITCIANSLQLGLLAIGCNNGQIHLYDSTQNFLLKGVIVQPYDLTIPSVTCLSFVGGYPFLFSGNTNGDIFCHSIRPYLPMLQIITQFKHATYQPIQRQLSVNYEKNVQGYINVLNYCTRCASLSTTKYTYQKRMDDEFLTFILLKNASEIYHYFMKTEVQNVDAVQQYLASLQSQSINISQANKSMESFGEAQSASLTSLRQFNVIDNQKYWNGPRQMLTVHSAKEIQVLQENSKEEIVQRSEYGQQVQIFNYFFKVLGFTKQKPEENMMLASAGTTSTKQNQYNKIVKQRKNVTKIKGLVLLIGMLHNFKSLALKQKSAFIATNIEVAPVEEQPIILPSSSAPQKTKIMMQVNTKRTNQFLKDMDKQKKRKQQNAQNQLVLPSPDDASMKSGFIYKKVHVDREVHQFPLRVQDVRSIRCEVVPTTMYYDVSTQVLVVGDELGYITEYDMHDTFKTVNVQDARKKYITIERDKIKEEIDDGYEKQYLAVKGQKIMEDFRTKPLLNPPRIIMTFRAHCGQIGSIEQLFGSHALLTYGYDRRLCCFDMQTGALLGLLKIDERLDEFEVRDQIP